MELVLAVAIVFVAPSTPPLAMIVLVVLLLRATLGMEVIFIAPLGKVEVITLADIGLGNVGGGSCCCSSVVDTSRESCDTAPTATAAEEAVAAVIKSSLMKEVVSTAVQLPFNSTTACITSLAFMHSLTAIP